LQKNIQKKFSEKIKNKISERKILVKKFHNKVGGSEYKCDEVGFILIKRGEVD